MGKMKVKPKKMFLHVHANGSVIFKSKRSKDNPYYGAPTHALFLIPTKRKRITQKLEIGAICNDSEGNLYEIVNFKPLPH